MGMPMLVAASLVGLCVGSALWDAGLNAVTPTRVPSSRCLAGATMFCPCALLLVGSLSILAADRFDDSVLAGTVAAAGFVALSLLAIGVAVWLRQAALTLLLIGVADVAAVATASLVVVRAVA